MKRTLLALAAFCSLTGAAFAVEFKVGPTLDDVMISGVRPYAADGNTVNDGRTSSKLAPGLFIRGGLGKWEIGANYRYLSNLNGFGIAPTSDIFHTGGAATAVLTPYTIEEKIHELSISGGYKFLSLPVVDITAGPTLNMFASTADFRAPNGGTFYRSMSSTDFKPGAFVRASFSFLGPWSFDVSYRYSAPPGRRLQSLGIGLGIGI